MLNNSRALEKGQLYSFLKSLLGEGLLTASGIYIRLRLFLRPAKYWANNFGGGVTLCVPTKRKQYGIYYYY